MAPGNRRKTGWIWGFAVCLFTLLIFWPSLKFPFFPFWDDDIHVHANPSLHPLTGAGVLSFWTRPYQQLFIPLTYSVWAGLALLSRWRAGVPLASGPLDPAWFHGTNVLLHAGSTVMVFLLLRHIMLRAAPSTDFRRMALASALGAAFFGWHPLQVEPVAWISGLRDVLGGFLGLAALVVFFREGNGSWRWPLATLLFLASLTAKPAGVALPFVAALVAGFSFAWKPARVARELAPWFLLALAWTMVTRHAQSAADLASHLVPIWVRPLVATDALAFYLGKTLWPVGLAADYGRAPDVAWQAGWLGWTWIGPGILVFMLAAVPAARRFLLPAGLFVAALLPTLGLIPFNFQVVSTVADRYAYLALLGPALALALTIVHSKKPWPVALSVAVVIGLASLTIGRLPLWSEDLRLFAATLDRNPTSWKAMHNYASALDDRGRTAEAEPLMNRVIQLRPESAEAHNDLGVMLWRLGRRDQAVAETRRALEIRPTANAAKNLVLMESRLQNWPGYLDALRKVVALDPADLSQARQLAWVLATAPEASLRNGPEALRLAQAVLEAGGATPEAMLVLVAAQAEVGDFSEAQRNARDTVLSLERAGHPLAESARRDILAVVESRKPIRSQLPNPPQGEF